MYSIIGMENTYILCIDKFQFKIKDFDGPLHTSSYLHLHLSIFLTSADMRSRCLIRG